MESERKQQLFAIFTFFFYAGKKRKKKNESHLDLPANKSKHKTLANLQRKIVWMCDGKRKEFFPFAWKGVIWKYFCDEMKEENRKRTIWLVMGWPRSQRFPFVIKDSVAWESFLCDKIQEGKQLHEAIRKSWELFLSSRDNCDDGISASLIFLAPVASCHCSSLNFIRSKTCNVVSKSLERCGRDSIETSSGQLFVGWVFGHKYWDFLSWFVQSLQMFFSSKILKGVGHSAD